MAGNGNRRNGRAQAGERRRGGGAVLSQLGGAGAGRSGSLWQQSVVCRFVAAVRTRGVGRRCGPDPSQLRAAAEDGQAGRGAHTAAAGGGPVSEVVGSRTCPTPAPVWRLGGSCI